MWVQMMMASANTVDDMVWSLSPKYRISITSARMVTRPFLVRGCDTVRVLFPVDLSVVPGVDSDGENEASTLTMLGLPFSTANSHTQFVEILFY